MNVFKWLKDKLISAFILDTNARCLYIIAAVSPRKRPDVLIKVNSKSFYYRHEYEYVDDIPFRCYGRFEDFATSKYTLYAEDCIIGDITRKYSLVTAELLVAGYVK